MHKRTFMSNETLISLKANHHGYQRCLPKPNPLNSTPIQQTPLLKRCKSKTACTFPKRAKHPSKPTLPPQKYPPRSPHFPQKPHPFRSFPLLLHPSRTRIPRLLKHIIDPSLFARRDIHALCLRSRKTETLRRRVFIIDTLPRIARAMST